MGSGTIAIACYKAGISLTACEINDEYFIKALRKIKENVCASHVVEENSNVFIMAVPHQTDPSNKHTICNGRPTQLQLFMGKQEK